MRRGNWKLVMLRDFSRGMVSNQEPHEAAQGEWLELSNVRLNKDGSFDKRGGSTKKNDTIFLRYD